jgi:hypothetical protein
MAFLQLKSETAIMLNTFQHTMPCHSIPDDLLSISMQFFLDKVGLYSTSTLLLAYVQLIEGK